jgi:glyoxylase-like metal-dependent hydrolase (beta-lactamase superfamily II)
MSAALELTSLDYPFADPPAHGAPREVTRGVRWVRMPLPFQLNHINLWLLEDGDRWAMVDCGYGNEETRDLWRGILKSHPLGRLVVTHYHPDHVGNAAWIADEHGLTVEMTEAEFLHAVMWCHTPADVLLTQRHKLWQRHGVAQERLDKILGRGNPYVRGAPSVPLAYHRLGGGDRLTIGGRDWEVIIGRGHCPEQACLFTADGNVLIAGDQILPKISPNVSITMEEPEGNPLGQFLETLDRFSELPADTLVLPSHGLPFRGLHARIDWLRAHHASRLVIVRDACATAKTAAEITHALFPRELDDHQYGFAFAETMAHVNYLVHSGEIVRDGGDPVRFSVAR